MCRFWNSAGSDSVSVSAKRRSLLANVIARSAGLSPKACSIRDSSACRFGTPKACRSLMSVPKPGMKDNRSVTLLSMTGRSRFRNEKLSIVPR